MNEQIFFKDYFANASVNAICIMDSNGVIVEVNEAFTKNFDYTTNDLKGKNFSELFTAIDRNKNKFEIELKEVLKNGQAKDEGFIINKAGHPL